MQIIITLINANLLSGLARTISPASFSNNLLKRVIIHGPGQISGKLVHLPDSFGDLLNLAGNKISIIHLNCKVYK